MWKFWLKVLGVVILFYSLVSFVFYFIDGFTFTNVQFTLSFMLTYFVDAIIIFLVVAAIFAIVLAVGSLVASIVDHIQGDKN